MCGGQEEINLSFINEVPKNQVWEEINQVVYFGPLPNLKSRVHNDLDMTWASRNPVSMGPVMAGWVLHLLRFHMILSLLRAWDLSALSWASKSSCDPWGCATSDVMYTVCELCMLLLVIHGNQVSHCDLPFF